jgi:hypothetical protein
MPRPGVGMPSMMPQQPNMGGQMNPMQLYISQAVKILPAVDVANPNYKQQVGEFIYEHVETIAGSDHAPKITGMLIDLPLDEIKEYLT